MEARGARSAEGPAARERQPHRGDAAYRERNARFVAHLARGSLAPPGRARHDRQAPAQVAHQRGHDARRARVGRPQRRPRRCGPRSLAALHPAPRAGPALVRHAGLSRGGRAREGGRRARARDRRLLHADRAHRDARERARRAHARDPRAAGRERPREAERALRARRPRRAARALTRRRRRAPRRDPRACAAPTGMSRRHWRTRSCRPCRRRCSAVAASTSPSRGSSDCSSVCSRRSRRRCPRSRASCPRSRRSPSRSARPSSRSRASRCGPPCSCSPRPWCCSPASRSRPPWSSSRRRTSSRAPRASWRRSSRSSSSASESLWAATSPASCRACRA
jgi:hypothetical protein